MKIGYVVFVSDWIQHRDTPSSDRPYSSFFTALNDGLVSAAISFLRTLVFQVAAEVLAVAVTALFLTVKRKQYRHD